MRANKLKDMLHAGNTGVGLFATVDSGLAAEHLAHAGYDFIFADQQHGAIDNGTLASVLTAMSSTETTPIVRVPDNDPAAVMRALDLGALGVVCPLVNTAEQATRFVHALRYPPDGGRSWGPSRAILYGADYAQAANDRILAIAQVETREAVENLDAILDTPGLDAILVGPNDLGFSYGQWPQPMPDAPDVVAAMRAIPKACRDKGVFAGIHCGDTVMAREMIDWGYQFVSVSSDLGLMVKAAQESIAAARD